MRIQGTQLITLIFLSLFTLVSYGEMKEKPKQSKSKKMSHSKDHKHDSSKASAKKVDKDKLLIKVNGMVCAFCAQGVEKNFNSRKEVKGTKVDLDKMEVLITYKEGQSIPEKEVKKLIEGAGFEYVGVVNE